MDYALKNRILIGDRESPAFNFGNGMLAAAPSGVSSVDPIGNELSVDTFSFTVRVEPKMMVYGTASGVAYRLRSGWFYGIGVDNSFAEKIEAIEFGTPVWWYIYDGDTQRLFVNGIVKAVEQLTAISWKLTCLSDIGLLDSKIHKGGMYNAQLQSVLADVIGDAFPYTVADALKTIAVPGWLPYQSARENLHLLLFSCGASIVRDPENDGEYSIRVLESLLHELEADHLSINSSIKRELPATRVEVMEHSFAALSSDETVTLYDNTAAATGSSNVTIVFDSPMHDLAVTGSLTISESNCNYAVVSGTGTLTGKRFTHITREVVIDTTPQGANPRTVRVADNCLVNSLNSDNVARRLMAYYGACRRFKAKAILSVNNKAGQNFILNPAFFGNQNAFLEKMNYNISSVVGADCEFRAGYVPAYVGNTYTRVEVLGSNSDTFSFNAGTVGERIRLVVIGSGDGGSGGHGGQCGCGRVRSRTMLNPPVQDGVLYPDQDPVYDYGGYTYTEGQGARAGGLPGTPGKAGKIFIIDLIVYGQTSVSAVIPQGGEGGDGSVAEHWRGSGSLEPWIPETEPKPGKPGSETVAVVDTHAEGRSVTNNYTSANGAVSSSGYFDPIGEIAYAMPGAKGFQGGTGGRTDNNSFIDRSGSVPYCVGLGGWSGKNGMKGADVGANEGGAGGSGAIVVGSSPVTVHGQTLTYSASGGAGSGAAWGVDGNPGTDAVITQQQGYAATVVGGDGGDGVKPLTPPVPTPGTGGTAGHGGSSGGSAGGLFDKDFATRMAENLDIKGKAGAAGDGGDGGQGGPGVVLVYHNLNL